MEALHSKLRLEAEKLVDAEFNHKRVLNDVKVESERRVEQLQCELNHLRASRSPRGSAEGLVR